MIRGVITGKTGKIAVLPTLSSLINVEVGIKMEGVQNLPNH